MDRIGRVLAEHRELELTLDLLAVLAAAPPNLLPLVRFRRLLAHETRRAQEALKAHFRFEEEGGYMVEISRARPMLTPKLVELKEQHACILRALDEVQDELNVAIDPLQQTRELSDVARVIRRHEEEENSLCQLALMQDVGVGG